MLVQGNGSNHGMRSFCSRRRGGAGRGGYVHVVRVEALLDRLDGVVNSGMDGREVEWLSRDWTCAGQTQHRAASLNRTVPWEFWRWFTRAPLNQTRRLI